MNFGYIEALKVKAAIFIAILYIGKQFIIKDEELITLNVGR